MNLPPALPDLLVDEGARRLALAHLADGITARARLTGGADPEALHDYRVALRRLRSCLRSYRNELRSTVTRRSFRRLRRLARGTNRSRDLEVHLQWLRDRLGSAGETARPGVQWVIQRLEAAGNDERDAMMRRDEARFPRLQKRLTAQLSEYRTRVRLDRDAGKRSTGRVSARRIRAASKRLGRRLLPIQGYENEEAIHRARIAAKHLRYLLEPFAGGVPGLEPAIEELKGLQDSSGDVHDAQIFAGELRKDLAAVRTQRPAGTDVRPGIQFLLGALQQRGRQAYDEFRGGWLGGAAEPRLRRIDELADAVADLADRDVEIERKFLLNELPSLENAEGPVEIEQGYLPGDRLVERLRRVTSEEGVELFRTLKEGSGLTRLEIEESVPPEVFARFWPLTEGRRIRKRRYRVPDGKLKWEIDEFLDRDLLLAEVELPEQQAEVEVPEWLRPHVEREVTEDSAYSNLSLARASNGDGERGP